MSLEVFTSANNSIPFISFLATAYIRAFCVCAQRIYTTIVSVLRLTFVKICRKEELIKVLNIPQLRCVVNLTKQTPTPGILRSNNSKIMINNVVDCVVRGYLSDMRLQFKFRILIS